MITVPSSESDKEKIRDAVVEMSNSMLRQEAERDLQKDICNSIKDEVGLEPKYLKKMANIYHKQNFSEVQSEHEEFETLYEEIIK
jgi:hypothetical protein